MELLHFPNHELPLKTKYVVESTQSNKFPKKAGFEWQKPADGALGHWYTYDPAVAIKLSSYANESVKEQIQAGLDFKNEIYNLSFSDGVGFKPEFNIPVPKGINPKTGKLFSYFPFQRVGIYLGHMLKSLILGDEMGLGKTIQAIGIINMDPTIKSVLVVTKKKLKSKLVKEFKCWLTRKMSVGAGLLNCDVVIVNYDQLVRRTIMVQSVGSDGEPMYQKNGKPILEPMLDENGNEMYHPNPLLDALIERDWDMLVVDECHKIKNDKARRTKGIFEIAGWSDDPALHNPERIRYRVALTGTPIPNRPIEMLTTLKLLIPFSKLSKRWYYGKRYCKGNTTSTVKYHGNCNLEELQLKLRQTVLIRRMKAQVMKELPPKMHSIVTLDAEGSALAFVKQQIAIQLEWQKKSKELKYDMQLYKEKDAALYHAAFSKLKECQGVYFTEMAKIRKKLGVEKVPYVVDHVEAMLESGIEKILIGIHHSDVSDGIADALAAWGVVTLDGRNQSQEYQDEVESAFMTNPDCRVFIGGIQSCGEGLDLYSAHHVVFAELDWVPSNIKQFEDRTHRIGQENHVMVEHLVFDGSLDSKFIETLIDKQAIEDAALNTHAEQEAA